MGHNEVLGCMLTHTNTLTKHYYIQSSATLLPPSQRHLYPNAALLFIQQRSLKDYVMQNMIFAGQSAKAYLFCFTEK